MLMNLCVNYTVLQPKVMLYRFILLFAGGLLGVFGSRQVHLDGAGPLGVLTLAFVVNLRWRKELGPDQEVIDLSLRTLVNQIRNQELPKGK